ncbi:hypothetical protein [Hydrogenophaga sp. OTU3427]|uniref:hypothetical protein n=1 Tax=Hydrogenophaga sp. OTU3427 TaxID=3043856 RepID=UPI00313F03F3
MQIQKCETMSAAGIADSRTCLTLVGGVPMEPKVLDAYLRCVEESVRAAKLDPVWSSDRVRPVPLRTLVKAMAHVPMVDSTEFVPAATQEGDDLGGADDEPQSRLTCVEGKADEGGEAGEAGEASSTTQLAPVICRPVRMFGDGMVRPPTAKR